MFVVTPTSVANKNSRAGAVAVRLCEVAIAIVSLSLYTCQLA